MRETLLDFDTADASGDRGAVTPLNLKISKAHDPVAPSGLVPQTLRGRLGNLSPKKLRESAPKRLKTFVRVNLCAGLRPSRKSRASPWRTHAPAARRVRPPAPPS